MNAAALWLVSQAITGLQITGGWQSYLAAGIALWLIHLIIKPVLSLISLPLMIATMGFFSVLLNALLLYLLTLIVTQVRIVSYTFAGIEYNGFRIPELAFNGFFTTLLSAFAIALVIGFIDWLFEL